MKDKISKLKLNTAVNTQTLGSVSSGHKGFMNATSGTSGDSLGGAAKNLRCRLSTSSSTGMLRRPHRWPRRVGAILTHTSLLPDARTPSSRLASRESLQACVGGRS